MAVKRKLRRDDFMMGTPFKTLKYKSVEILLQPCGIPKRIAAPPRGATRFSPCTELQFFS
jgi:hypothetical protein